MKIEVVSDLSEQRVLSELDPKQRRGIWMASNEFRRLANGYARRDTGQLIESSYTSSNLAEGIVEWNTPYASAVYYNRKGTTVSTDKNPNAVDHWADPVIERHAEDIARLVEREMSR